ncbi:cyanovirin-N family protein, partial [Penicillium lagena]|uniref:cyanovirin-N family protein n=1 Tax=Penicillium lagena TaxID=94218 RepID=UPI00254006CB
MSFHTSSVNITLRNRHTLSCRCERPDGSWSYSRLDLNECLGNNNGEFVWGGHNFAHSASQIHLSLEGKDGTPWLHAQLDDRHGSTQSAS